MNFQGLGYESSAVAARMAVPTRHADTFLEISFATQGYFAAGAVGLSATWMGGVMWSHGPNLDWSYQTPVSTFAGGCTPGQSSAWDHVTVYIGGVLVWGIEPTAATDP